LLEASSPIHMFARRAAVCLLISACAVPAALPLFFVPALADESGGGDDDGNGGDNDGGADDDGTGNGGEGFRNDQKEAWRARNSGDIRPLRGIIARIRRTYGGSVLDVKLKHREGRAWYVIRIMDSHDRVRTLRVKAGRARRGKNWN